MSGVFARNRKSTPFDPIDTCAKLQDKLAKFIADEKYVPKKWRFLLGVRILDKIDELMDTVFEANGINTRSHPELKDERKRLWHSARIKCDQLDRQIARLINVCPQANAGDMTEIIKLLDEEDTALSKAH